MAKKKKNFDDSLKRLEEIINIMENEETALDESVTLYKEGVDLSIFCMDNLSKSEKEVTLLTKDLEGNFALEKFTE